VHDPNALRIDGCHVLLEIRRAGTDRLRTTGCASASNRSNAARGAARADRRPAGGCRSHQARRRISDALRVAAETMRYCIAPASTLFTAVAAHLSGDTAAVAAYRCLLATQDGPLP
jgi:hypothetical protein